MQAMHVFLEHKRDIEYCCLDGGQITDVAGKQNQIHTVAFGVTTQCTEHVGLKQQSFSLEQGKCFVRILAEMPAVVNGISCNFS
jgi:hypothetical protein